MISNIKDGILGGEYHKLTLENEGLVMEYDKDFKISDELMAIADETTIAGIVSGDIAPIPEMTDEDMSDEDNGETATVRLQPVAAGDQALVYSRARLPGLKPKSI